MKRFLIVTLLAIAAAGAMADNPNGLPPGIAKKMGPPPPPYPGPEVHVIYPGCMDCARVLDVRLERRKGEGGAVGIVAGAAAGGLLGNQVGKGDGKVLATVGGAVAGGFIGNEVQKRVTGGDRWVTDVRMRDGSIRTIEQEAQPAWSRGAIVRVAGNSVVLMRSAEAARR
jgi:outer membrane lipoprotein SlyB